MKDTSLSQAMIWVPLKLKISGRIVSTKLPKAGVPYAREWTRRVFKVPNVAILECSRGDEPSIIIEPQEIRWFRKRGKPEEIEKAKEVLVSVAEKIEKEG